MMVKKWIALFLSLCLLPCFLVPVFGETVSYVSDEAGLLSGDEISNLESTAANLAEAYQIDAVILTVDSLGGVSAQDYADDYYDHSGYREDGILFLLAMEEREWYISTCGKVIYAVTDYGAQQLGEGILPYLSDGDWYRGFLYFLDMLPFYLDAYEKGKPIDGFADYSGDYYHGEQEEVVHYEEESSSSLATALICGLAAAGISIAGMRAAMNTKRAKRSAGNYLQDDSWDLHKHRDLFLYSKVHKARRQEPKAPSGGGSSVHRSSSGRSHGGGGGRF